MKNINISQGRGLMRLTLDRPEALNALNRAMVDGIVAQLDLAENDSAISHIVFEGAGEKAFCAGGDIKAARLAAIECREGRADIDKVMDFFRVEYAMNCRLFHYPKNTISLMNGITMGGGVGVANACKYKIATEKTVWAMPEVSIGFFPDVGAGYYLSRAPRYVGRYLGLTGTHLNNAGDLIKCGLADYYMSSENIVLLKKNLEDFDGDIKNILQEFASSSPEPELPYDCIEACFSAETVEEILARLDEMNSDWGRATASLMRSKSPTSLKVTLKHLMLSENQSFDDISARELKIAARILISDDFIEGVRAVVVDKDRNPQWKPDRLSDVELGQIDHYF